MLVDAARTHRARAHNARGIAMLSEGTVIRDASGKLAVLECGRPNRRLHDFFVQCRGGQTAAG
jgi:hypothetical protein